MAAQFQQFGEELAELVEGVPEARADADHGYAGREGSEEEVGVGNVA